MLKATAGTGRVRASLALLLVAALAACGADQPILMNISSDGTPDEFAVLPNKPIEIPRDLSALPAPTPGAGNRVDPTPQADAVAALGGNAGALSRGGIPAGEQGLVAQATRYGVSPTIRSQLAAEDLEYRRSNDGRLLERIFDVNVYFKAYRRQSLDQHRALERFRRAGVRTVGAPPEGLTDATE